MWMIVRAAAARHPLRRPSMLAALWNAPARPLLTRSVLLVLSIVILGIGLLALVIGGSAARDEVPAPDRPAFTRRAVER
jgi:hypothetical protein